MVTVRFIWLTDVRPIFFAKARPSLNGVHILILNKARGLFVEKVCPNKALMDTRSLS